MSLLSSKAQARAPMSRQWSCETLGDGFQSIMAEATGMAPASATTEADLERQIKDACLTFLY